MVVFFNQSESTLATSLLTSAVIHSKIKNGAISVELIPKG